MSNINELFVPYAESLELKVLGFDEPCFAVHYEHKCYQYTKARGIKNSDKTSQQWICTAPTFSQAFKFFRDKKMLGEVFPIDDWETWGYQITLEDSMSPFFIATKSIYPEFNTYEEAELECLRKLIEIIKT